MPGKRKIADETTRSTPKKAKAQTTDKVKQEGSPSNDGDAHGSGGWSREDERTFFLCALAHTAFKPEKEFRDKTAKLIGRSEKAVKNYWFKHCSKAVTELKGAEVECKGKEGDNEEGND